MEPDGVLLGTSEFRDGTGIFRDWFDTGELKSEVSFYHGRITGRIRNWDPDGMLYGTNYFFENRPISKKGYRAKCKSNRRLPRFKDEKATNTLGNYVRQLRRAKREQAQKGLTHEQLEEEKWFELRCKNATKGKDSRELLAWFGKNAEPVRELGEMSRGEGLGFARKLLALGALKAWVTGIERDHDGAEYSKNLIVLIPPNAVKRGKIYEFCAHPARPLSDGAGPAVKVGTSYMRVSFDVMNLAPPSSQNNRAMRGRYSSYTSRCVFPISSRFRRFMGKYRK
jgi:hypothetical protein